MLKLADNRTTIGKTIQNMVYTDPMAGKIYSEVWYYDIHDVEKGFDGWMGGLVERIIAISRKLGCLDCRDAFAVTLKYLDLCVRWPSQFTGACLRT